MTGEKKSSLRRDTCDLCPLYFYTHLNVNLLYILFVHIYIIYVLFKGFGMPTCYTHIYTHVYVFSYLRVMYITHESFTYAHAPRLGSDRQQHFIGHTNSCHERPSVDGH